MPVALPTRNRRRERASCMRVFEPCEELYVFEQEGSREKGAGEMVKTCSSSALPDNALPLEMVALAFRFEPHEITPGYVSNSSIIGLRKSSPSLGNSLTSRWRRQTRSSGLQS
jgi:hypothetical protein